MGLYHFYGHYTFHHKTKYLCDKRQKNCLAGSDWSSMDTLNIFVIRKCETVMSYLKCSETNCSAILKWSLYNCSTARYITIAYPDPSHRYFFTPYKLPEHRLFSAFSVVFCINSIYCYSTKLLKEQSWIPFYHQHWWFEEVSKLIHLITYKWHFLCVKINCEDLKYQ